MTRSQNRSHRILVVDDDPAFQESTRVILESAGYVVYLAANSGEGLRNLCQIGPDLIILDVMMTDDRDGYRFARSLAEDPRYHDYRNTPVIMLTAAYGDTLYQFESHPFEEFVHVHDLVSKPLSPEDLINRVQRYLGPTSGRE